MRSVAFNRNTDFEVPTISDQQQSETAKALKKAGEPETSISNSSITIPPEMSNASENHGRQDFVVTIITRLAGETGNWLLYIAKSKVLQWRLERDYGIRSELKYQVRQKQKKCLVCIEFITTCFPNLATIDFDNVKLSHPNFLGRAMTKRQAWLDQTNMGGNRKNPDIKDSMTVEEEQERLQQLQQVLKIHTRNSQSPPYNDPNVRNISIPFLHIESFLKPHDYNDFYHELRDYFRFDDEICCKDALLPDANVSVFHFRGYGAEESLAQSKEKGREELSPNKVATELFTDLQPGDRVALLSRFDETSTLVQDHVDAFTAQHNNQVSVQVIHQTPFQKDFCYLRHAKKELVGMGYSTFVRFAGFLVKYQPRVRLYCLDSLDTRHLANQDGQVSCRHFDFTNHPHLQALYSDEVYRSEEMDEMVEQQNV